MKNIFFDINDLAHVGTGVIIGKTVRIRNPEKVSIGDNTIIDDFTYISGSIEIGEHVHVGAGCTLSGSKKKIFFHKAKRRAKSGKKESCSPTIAFRKI